MTRKMVSPPSYSEYRCTPFQREVGEAVARLDARLPSTAFSDAVRRQLYEFALIRNSWGTTNIDSGPITLERVEELYEAYERGYAQGGNRILPTDREVLNYFSLVRGLPIEPFPVSLEDLRLLHYEYFHGVPLQNGAQPGQWKRIDNRVEGPWGILQTTPKERVERDLQALLDWVNGPGQAEPVTVRAAVFFHEFQRIHPFGDGNGRVGRLAAISLLSLGGLPGVRYVPIDDAINEDRHEYYLALRQADNGDLSAWVSYWGAQLKSGYLRATLLAERLQRIPPSVPEGSHRLLEWLYIHRVEAFRFRDVEGFYLGASKSTIIRRLKELEELGFVQRLGHGQGSRYAVQSLHAVSTKTGNPGDG